MWGSIVFSVLFTALIWAAGTRLEAIELLPDGGPSWYYWKLPEPTLWTRATAWGFYALHQVTMWGLIYYAQQQKTKYKGGLHRVNVIALAANAFFIVLHFAQTHLWYDGLAQDVSIWSSQGSVIILLVAVLLMENRRRGMFWGKPLPISKEIVGWMRRYHGYIFAWATVYTFWYHPMVSTPTHLIGFLYMFFMLIQGSLFFTRLHVNRWWTMIQEAAVLVHGTLTAMAQGKDLWPMFFFGFAGIFVITQMHGLRLRSWHKWSILALYLALTAWAYQSRGLARLNEIIRVPVIEYLAVLLLAGIVWAGLAIARRVRKNAPETMAAG